MLALNLITDEIPPLKSSDTGEMAMKWMDEFKVSHLPVLKGGAYVGLVSDADLLDMNSPGESIENQKLGLERPYVLGTQHIYSVIKLVSDLQLTAIPVLDEEENFLGLISIQSLLMQISNIASINEPGGIVVLELTRKDYSMAQIAQIVEGNGALIMSSFITSASESTNMQVTLKINKSDLSGILQTFQRYDYSVAASFQETTYQEDLKRRYDGLMNFLNI